MFYHCKALPCLSFRGIFQSVRRGRRTLHRAKRLRGSQKELRSKLFGERRNKRNNTKGFARKFFLLCSLFGRAGAPPFIFLSSFGRAMLVPTIERSGTSVSVSPTTLLSSLFSLLSYLFSNPYGQSPYGFIFIFISIALFLCPLRASQSHPQWWSQSQFHLCPKRALR